MHSFFTKFLKQKEDVSARSETYSMKLNDSDVVDGQARPNGNETGGYERESTASPPASIEIEKKKHRQV